MCIFSRIFGSAIHPAGPLIPEVTVLGEAAAACLISTQGKANCVLSVVQKRVDPYVGSPLRPERARAHRAGHEARFLVEVVQQAMAAAGLETKDISLILAHNVNRLIWNHFSRIFPCALHKLYLDNIPRIGHCFTSDPFINFVSARREGRIQSGDIVVLVSVGLAMIFCAAVVRV